jgi:hypothetical protein
MKLYRAADPHVVAVAIGAMAFAALFATAMAGTSLAQDAMSPGGASAVSSVSSWDELDSVLILPPVYRPKAAPAAGSEPADSCGEDCADPDGRYEDEADSVPGSADNPANAAAGTADNPADDPTAENPINESAAAEGNVDTQESEAQKQGSGLGSQPGDDNLDGAVGTAQDYAAQQADAAAELGNYGIAPAPSVIVAVPMGSYYLPGTVGSLPPWMPRPMARVAPLPSIVPYRLPRTMAFRGGGFPHSFGGFRGGGFGHR